MSTEGPVVNQEKSEVSEEGVVGPKKGSVRRARSNSGPILRLLETRRKSLDDIATDRVGLTSPRGHRESPRRITVSSDSCDQNNKEQPKSKPKV